MSYTIGTTGVDAKLLFEKLISMQPGEILNYSEIKILLGRDVQKHRHILTTARNMAKRDKSYLYDCISNVGIKRLTDSEIIGIESVKPLSRIRSAIKKGIINIQCAKNITNDEVIKQNATISMLGAISLFSKPNSIEKVKQETITGPIASSRVLEMFK